MSGPTSGGSQMIIGERFAWGHIARTGGDATWQLFTQVVPDLVVHADPLQDPRKHDPFDARGGDVTRKPVLAVNIRRLPSRQLSLAYRRYRRGTGRDPAPKPMSTPDEVAGTRQPDALLRKFTSDGRLRIDRWLRMEYLREDFVEFVSTLRPLSREEIDLTRAIVTKPPTPYDHDVTNFFTVDQIRRLYDHNPLWAQAEREVYGGLAVLDETAGTWRDSGYVPPTGRRAPSTLREAWTLLPPPVRRFARSVRTRAGGR